jgi:hypothetical protein
MIDSVTVPLGQFDLEGYLEGYRQFYRAWAGEDADADASVPVLRTFGDTPQPVYDNRDLAGELLNRGWLLFFSMHEPLVDDTALCIDGLRREVGAFDIGPADTYGFLVEVRDGRVSLHPAFYDGSSGPAPTVEFQAHCSVLDEPMARFAARFVRSN